MDGSRIVSKSLIYFIGNFSSKILTSLLVPIYAFYIRPDELGNYDLAQTIMNIIVPILFVAIWEAILRFVLSEQDGNKVSKIINTSLIFIFTQILLFAVLTFIAKCFFVINTVEYVLIAIMLLSHGLAQIWQYYSRALKANKIYVISGMVGTVVNFMVTVILICILNVGVYGLYIANIVGQLSILVLIEFALHIIKFFNFKDFDFQVLKKLVGFSAPLVLNTISLWLIPLIMRFIIMSNLGTSAIGLYAFANKFNMIVNLIGTVVTMAVIEEAILTSKEDKAIVKFNDTIQKLFTIFQSLIIVAIPLVCIFYWFIRKTEYYVSMPYIPWFLAYASAMTLSSNIGSIFQVADATKYQFVTTMAGGIVGCVFSIIFVRQLNIYSILVGQLVCAVVILLLRYLISNKLTGFVINWFPVLLDICIFFIVSMISINVSLIQNILLVFVVMLYVIIKNHRLLKSMINSIQRKV